MNDKKLRIILNFIVKLLSALGIIALGVLIMLQSNQLGEGTTATLITLIVGALGVSIGFNLAKEKLPAKEPDKK